VALTVDQLDRGVATAHRLWANQQLPGELGQVLPTPRHFEQAAGLVTHQAVAGAVACGPDPQRHLAAVRQFVEAGFDEVYVQQIGPDQEAFFDAWATHVLPRAQELVAP